MFQSSSIVTLLAPPQSPDQTVGNFSFTFWSCLSKSNYRNFSEWYWRN